MARKPFSIRDPVHGYLEIAAHERKVIDHPITQRLRRVTQTGLADLVFPEARTSRLVHSFGAIHLASRFVLACLENADEAVALDFFDQIRSLDILDQSDYQNARLKDLDALLIADTPSGTGGLSAV